MSEFENVRYSINDISVGSGFPGILSLLSLSQLCQELRAKNLADGMSSEPIAKPVPTPVRSLVASEVAAPDDETQPADTLDAQDACRVSRCGG